MKFMIESYSDCVKSKSQIEIAEEITASKMLVQYNDKEVVIILDNVPEIIADKFIKHESLDYIPRSMIFLSVNQALTLSEILKTFAEYRINFYK